MVDMYSYAMDEYSGTLVGVFSGSDMTDEHYERSLAVMNRADLVANDHQHPFIYIVVVDRDVPRPPALWRKRFSDANYRVKSARFYFVMVTNSMLMRGVYTAVTWLTSKRDGQYYNVVGGIADAQAWLRAHQVSCPDLERLEARARTALKGANDARE